MAKRRKRSLSAEESAGLRLAMWLSLPGYLLGGFLLLNHWAAADASFCGISEWASCNAVNRSPYSEVLGVPVALMGALGFLAVSVFAGVRLLEPRSALGRFARPVLSAAALGGVAAGAYLTFIELFVLQLICILCVASFALFLVVVFLMRRSLLLPGARAEKPRGHVPAGRG